MNITQFTMEEVRCFGERQTLEIRPLTFLVGENSTGKTTALACFHVLTEHFRRSRVDFNASPYSLGTFKDIIRNIKEKNEAFKIGFTYMHASEEVKWIVEFVEKEGGFEPTVNSVTVEFSDGEIVLKIKDNVSGIVRLTSFDEKQNQYRIDCTYSFLEGLDYSTLFHVLKDPSIDVLKGRSKGKIALAKYLNTSERSIGNRYEALDVSDVPYVFSTSPIRSQPKRTYDPTREFNDPEGSDIPMLLMRIEATQKDIWKALKTQLVEFGKSSGLFRDIQIRSFEQALGDPFQLQFKVRGPDTNLVDVGYGVSQILPILVHILNPNISGHEMNFSLLQQPEVHLHPRAQAELSSLLTKLANTGNRSFIIETHSDYMIDRARIEIIRGNIRPEDVSLIYFEPKGRIVKVHNISFDKMANMVGVPPHYGEFFLKESKRLLGFKD